MEALIIQPLRDDSSARGRNRSHIVAGAAVAVAADLVELRRYNAVGLPCTAGSFTATVHKDDQQHKRGCSHQR
jgi:hypothetical protein